MVFNLRMFLTNVPNDTTCIVNSKINIDKQGVSTLFRNKRFVLNEMFQRKASKFAIIYV